METQKLIRLCPKCGREISYASKQSFKHAFEKDSLCKKCRPCSPIFYQRQAKGANAGSKNPFYGKHHSSKVIEDLKSGISAKHGKKNGMFGRSVYDVWVAKYGVEKADEKMAELKRKHSDNSRGEKNSMYGKPSPLGSGNGWKGWYKGWFFRSLRELSYMVSVIEKNGLKWECGEKKKFTIKYLDYKGTPRTYRPDFILDSKIMVEIKPAKLHNSVSVLLKKKAAEGFCLQNGMEYRIEDVDLLEKEDFLKLLLDGHIKILPMYKSRFEEEVGLKGL